MAVGVLARWADTAGIDIIAFDRIFMLEATRGALDARAVRRAGDAEFKTASDDGSPLGSCGAFISGRAVLRITTEWAFGAVRVWTTVGAAAHFFLVWATMFCYIVGPG